MKDKSFAEDVIYHMPRLSAYARKLAGRTPLAEDMVQETILRALLYSDQFKAGTNLSAWLLTILRNCFFNELRHSRRFSLLNEGDKEDNRQIGAEQDWSIELKELAGSFNALPYAQQEALTLVAVEGDSYETAAKKSGCACGTMKSRVSRARAALAQAVEAPRNRAALCKAEPPHFAHLIDAA